MTPEIKAKIEANHTLASALQMLIGFDERPECFGPVPSFKEQIAQLAASYKVRPIDLIREYEHVTGDFVV